MKICPVEVFFLCLLHLGIGISAFAVGGALMLEPGGSLLGMAISGLRYTPFTNFFIPGLLLFLFLGLFPLLVLFGLLFKPPWEIFHRFNIYKDKHGAWTFSLYSGIIILTWIIIQQLTGGFFSLQPLVAAIGLLIIIITLLPKVSRYYDVKG